MQFFGQVFSLCCIQPLNKVGEAEERVRAQREPAMPDLPSSRHNCHCCHNHAPSPPCYSTISSWPFCSSAQIQTKARLRLGVRLFWQSHISTGLKPHIKGLNCHGFIEMGSILVLRGPNIALNTQNAVTDAQMHILIKTNSTNGQLHVFYIKVFNLQSEAKQGRWPQTAGLHLADLLKISSYFTLRHTLLFLKAQWHSRLCFNENTTALNVLYCALVV